MRSMSSRERARRTCGGKKRRVVIVALASRRAAPTRARSSAGDALRDAWDEGLNRRAVRAGANESAWKGMTRDRKCVARSRARDAQERAGFGSLGSGMG